MPRLELAAVLAQLWRDQVGRGARRPPPRSRSAGCRRSRRRVMPYSETCRPLRTAASRSRMLCWLGAREVLEQVAELVGGDDPQVDRHAVVGAPARRSRRGWTSATRSTSPSAGASAGGSSAVATMSRSLTLSASRRRRRPARRARRPDGAQLRDDGLGELERLVQQQARRGRSGTPAANASRSDSSDFRPNPRTPRSDCWPRPRAVRRASRSAARRRA